MITVKSKRELSLMRRAGAVVAAAHELMRESVKPGVTTKELDRIAEDYIVKQGAVPAFKGFYGFPASICASINEEVVHGIPGSRTLQEGDIISIDIGAQIDGFFGDAAKTYAVGKVDDKTLHLIKITEESLDKGIEMACVGNRLSDISYAVQTHAESNGFSVVRDYVGHGIGEKMHEKPQVPNFGSPGKGPRLASGMTLAIEPMINMGTYEVKTLKDGWTVVTVDFKPSAHFEHTVAVTEKGPEILTIV